MNFKKIALKAAKEAGKIHLKYFKTDLEIKEKSGSYDRVTVADTESEKKIVSIIKKHFPEHNILAEEAEYSKTDSGYTWVIDPLDGTNNFSHDIPIFCTSIALAKDNEVILGVIYDATRKEMFVAEKGKGAYLNGERLQVTDNTKMEQCILITGFYYDRGKPMLRTLSNMKNFLLKKVVGVRRFGSAALDLCNVACGRADGFWEFKLNAWDFAAGKLIVEEAGGKVTNINNENLGIRKHYVVASNGKVHDLMLKVLNKEN